MNISKKVKIYLGDLVHNYLGGGSYMFPLNVGFVASYVKKVFGDDVSVEIFKYPGHLIKRLKDAPPDMLGLSNYSWNVDLNNAISRQAKSLSPDMMILWGGPNINQTDEGYKAFFNEHPAVDFYVVNEGEIAFINLLSRYLKANCNIKKTKETEIDGCVFTRERAVVEGKRLERIEDLNAIPSPYLTGILDEFFHVDLIPIIETNRGCPFSCTYCAQGLVSQHRVKLFDIERVVDELSYIADRVKMTNILCFADANFGIADRDRKIAEHIRVLQKSMRYPRRCIINWVKTRQSIALADIMGESAYLVSSLQSIDPVVLKNIKRNNIDNAHFQEIINHINDAGGVSGTEIILALPGETKESHLSSLRQIFDWNVNYIICYNCLLINGSELTLPEERERFKFATKFRLIDSSFGKYDNFLSFESEEGIRSTSTMSEQDILFFRPVHWLIQFFWNYRCYFNLLKYMHLKGINPIDFIVSVIDGSTNAPLSVKNIFEDFRCESINEWFSSPGELKNYYSTPEKFEFLTEGGVGKMNGKYTWRVILECKKDFDEYIESVASTMLPGHKAVINDLVRFCAGTMPDFSGEVDFGSTVESVFSYDILSWQDGKYKEPLTKNNVSYLFNFSNEKRSALDVLISQYRHANKNVTMRKMTEHMRISDLYYDVERVRANLQK